ncbi:MAG: YihY/virulence factor BrkB family protein [Acidimicrobiales bacterium]
MAGADGIDIDATTAARPPLAPIALARWSWRLLKDVMHEYRADGVGDMAASITFWTLLSIPAAVLALVSTLSSSKTIFDTNAIERLESEIQDFIADTFADSQTLSDAVDELFNTNSAGVATVATIIALWSLSRGFAGLIRALDRAYEVEDGRKWWHIRLVGLALGIASVLVAAGSAITLALLPDLQSDPLLRLLVVPAVFAGIVLWAATVFHVGPYHRTPWRYDIPGAIVTAVGWVLSTQGFAYYIRVTEQANQVQSTVGAVLLGFTLLYLLSVVMLIGAEINDVISRRAGVVQQPVGFRGRYAEALERFQNGSDDED